MPSYAVDSVRQPMTATGIVEPVFVVRSGLHDRGWSESFEERLEQIDPVAELERAGQNGIRYEVQVIEAFDLYS